MRHNYNNLLVPYLQQRVEAMEKHIDKLNGDIECLQAQLEINQQAYYEQRQIKRTVQKVQSNKR